MLYMKLEILLRVVLMGKCVFRKIWVLVAFKNYKYILSSILCIHLILLPSFLFFFLSLLYLLLLCIFIS